MRFLLPVFAIGCLLSTLAAHADPIPKGFAKTTVGSGDKAIRIFTYKPAGYTDGPLLMVFHGRSRNAEDYCHSAAPLADKLNVVVAAPLFEEERFPSQAYIRGGVTNSAGEVQPHEQWTFPIVMKIITTLRKREAKPQWPYSFIGHSAGGQFLERFAAFQPSEATRIVAANPGSHLFPRTDWEYGYGFGGLPSELSNDEAMKRYLAAPITLYLGTADIDPEDAVLDKKPGAMKQGKFRLERGRACFAFAQKVAADHGWPFNWRKIEVEGIAHQGQKMLEAKEAITALRP